MARKVSKLSKVNFEFKHMEILLIILVLLMGVVVLYVIHRRTSRASVSNAVVNNAVVNNAVVSNAVEDASVNNEVEDASVNNAVENASAQKVLMLFYAEWCGASRQFLPVWDEIVESDMVNTQKINVDDNQELANKFNIQYLPTIYLVNGNNRIKYEGKRTKNSILQFVKQ